MVKDIAFNLIVDRRIQYIDRRSLQFTIMPEL